MGLELMRDEMVCQISARSATDTQVAAYLAGWNDAIEDSGKPLPCPSCYMEGEIRRLKSISDEGGVTIVRCEHCHQIFEFESPETK